MAEEDPWGYLNARVRECLWVWLWNGAKQHWRRAQILEW